MRLSSNRIADRPGADRQKVEQLLLLRSRLDPFTLSRTIRRRLERIWALRHLPEGFALDPDLDRQGQPSLPISRGLVSWVRKVGTRGRIEFNGAEYFVGRKLEHQDAIVTLSTHHRRIYIRHEGKLIKSIPFPFKGKVIKTLC